MPERTGNNPQEIRVRGLAILGQVCNNANMKVANLVSVGKAAAVAGVCRQTIYNAINSGRLKGCLVGGHWFVEAKAAGRFRTALSGPKVKDQDGVH